MSDMKPVPNLEEYADVEDALKRVCGNKAIYKKLLGTFKKSLQFDQLRQEAADGDCDAAAKTAHSIKGVTANLSLKAAYAKVVVVEGQLKDGLVSQPDIDELGEILRTTVLCTDYLVENL